MDELNPQGRDFRDLLTEMGQRYQFAKIPTWGEVLECSQNNQPLVFPAGSFLASNGNRIGVSFSFYRDGIASETRSSTKDAEEFLAEWLGWISESLNSKALEPHRKGYISEVRVAFDKSLSSLNKKLSAFARSLSIEGPAETQIAFELAGIQFWADPAINPGVLNFRIERENGSAFSENRYFSVAAMDTDRHIKVLSAFEDLLAD